MSLYGTLANNAGKNIGGVQVTKTPKIEPPKENQWIDGPDKGVGIFITPKK